MMRKVLALMLVLGMTSVVNAGVIDVVVDGAGSLGHAGTSTDPLEVGETLGIKIVLRNNPYYYGTVRYTAYDGYTLSGMDVDLEVSGPASLDVVTTAKGAVNLGKHAQFALFSTPDPLIVGNAIEYIAAAGPMAGIPATGGDVDLIWNLYIVCTGNGPVVLDLTLHGSTSYGIDYDPINGGPYTGDWVLAVEGDLGDLIIHQVPEPMTIALLGLGGLFLRRRR
jgi:hypothetical protein